MRDAIEGVPDLTPECPDRLLHSRVQVMCRRRTESTPEPMSVVTQPDLSALENDEAAIGPKATQYCQVLVAVLWLNNLHV